MVRFSVHILEGGYGEVIAERDGYHVILRGDLDFPAGSATLIGTFSGEYQRLEIPGSQSSTTSNPIEPETEQVDGHKETLWMIPKIQATPSLPRKSIR